MPTISFMQHLQSKTVAGLLTLLACVMLLAFFGKLTSEAVDALKWIGSTYFGVRAVANYVEQQVSK